MMFCENCGSPLPEDSKFCLNCGAKTPLAESGNQTIQEAAAAADAVTVDAMPAEDASVQTETQPEPPVVQPEPPAAQPGPAQYAPQPEPPRYAPQPEAPRYTPQPEPPRYAPQPAPQAQSYQQPVPPMPGYQQSAPITQPALSKTDRPLPTWKYIGMMILTGIPLIGFIMILVWSFGRSWNKNTRSFARAILILGIIGLVLSIVFMILNWAVLQQLTDIFNSNFEIDFG